MEENRDDSQSQSEHDIRASMAIANGFSSALDASFSELLGSYNSLVASMPDGVSESQLKQLRQTEQDCKYCLSRLVKSIEQLKGRLNNAEDLAGKNEATSSTGPAS